MVGKFNILYKVVLSCYIIVRVPAIFFGSQPLNVVQGSQPFKFKFSFSFKNHSGKKKKNLTNSKICLIV